LTPPTTPIMAVEASKLWFSMLLLGSLGFIILVNPAGFIRARFIIAGLVAVVIPRFIGTVFIGF